MLTRVRSHAARAAGVTAILAVTAALAGCGSDASDSDAEPTEPTSSATPEPTTYLPVPEGVTLTDPGTALELGEEGVIAFERRQDDVAVLAVTVQRIERTSFRQSFPDWRVDAATAARTPYFVRLEVANAGDVDLGGFRLDNVLWADDGTTLEAPNYYTSKQLPVCSGGPLPEEFPADATAELCQVYFIAPERTLQSVSFLPFGGLDAVTWSGEFSKVTPPEKKSDKKKSDKKKPAEQKPAETKPATPSESPS